MISVEYGPEGSDPIHKHDAHPFVYVLERSIVMQLKGEKEVTLSEGETFYDGPADIHLVGRNASTSSPAKIHRPATEEQGRSRPCSGAVTFSTVRQSMTVTRP